MDVFPVEQGDEVREGESFDPEAVVASLTRQIANLGSFQSLKQFRSGHSNLTYLLCFENKDLVLRRAPIGARVKSGHDMLREYRMLTHLHRVFAKVPKPLLACEDTDLLGLPFYVMERVEGVILRGRKKDAVPSPALMESLSRTCIAVLAEIHGIDIESAGLGAWGKPEAYVERQIGGWTRRYGKAKTHEIAAMGKVLQWLEENRPGECGASVIHNDYKYDNLVLEPDDLSTVRAVLDWEMATVGDPLMDLGTSLGYWVESSDPDGTLSAIPAGPTTSPGNLTRRDLVAEYGRLTGRDVSNVLFYYVYGLVKIAVIAQQIYQRFHLGITKDRRFGALKEVVGAFARQSLRAVEKGRIDDLG